MKLLSISTGKLDLVKSHLLRPFLTVGRSPVCDIVLRSRGIKPIHFIVEWIGVGAFKPHEGEWTLIDISGNKNLQNQDGNIEKSAEGEGYLLSFDSVKMGDYFFRFVKDALESTPELGGVIQKELKEFVAGSDPALLEILRIKSDTGAIEDIRHLKMRKKRSVEMPFYRFRNFKIHWDKGLDGPLAQLSIEGMEDAELFNRGSLLKEVKKVSVEKNDLLQVQWKGWEFYARFVNKINSPAVPRQIFGDVRLKKSFFFSLIVFFFMLMLLMSQPMFLVKPVMDKPRIVKIEIPPPEFTPTEIPTRQTQMVEEPPEPPEPQKQASKAKKTEKKKVVKSTAEKKTDLPPPEKPPTKSSELGIFGSMIKKNSQPDKSKTSKVNVSDILPETSLSSTSAQEAKIQIRSALPEDLTAPSNDEVPEITKRNTLKSASSKIKSESREKTVISSLVSPKKTAESLNSDFSSEKQSLESSVSNQGLNVEDLEFKVRGGGLDRETVRQVIRPFRGAIRACYEKALLTRPKIEGKITYRWDITPRGSVNSITVQKATAKSKQLETCVQAILQDITFPEAQNGLPTTVIYPFVFQASK